MVIREQFVLYIILVADTLSRRRKGLLASARRVALSDMGFMQSCGREVAYAIQALMFHAIDLNTRTHVLCFSLEGTASGRENASGSAGNDSVSCVEYG